MLLKIFENQFIIKIYIIIYDNDYAIINLFLYKTKKKRKWLRKMK